MLNKADGIWRKRGGFVESVCVFDFGAIDGLRLGMGGILLESEVGMMELLQYFVDLAWNRDVHSPVGVILRKGEDAGK